MNIHDEMIGLIKELDRKGYYRPDGVDKQLLVLGDWLDDHPEMVSAFMAYFIRNMPEILGSVISDNLRFEMSNRRVLSVYWAGIRIEDIQL